MWPAAILAADMAGTLVVSDRSDVRFRWSKQLTAPAGQPINDQPAGVDVSTQPGLDAKLEDRFWAFSLAYAVRATGSDLEYVVESNPPGSFQVDILQSGGATASWRYRRVSLTLSEGVSYGQLNSAYLSEAATTAPGQMRTQTLQTAPQNITVSYINSSTDLTLGLTFGKHTGLTLSAGYVDSGGVDKASQLQIPLEYGPHGSASFGYTFSGRDAVATQVSANSLQFSPSLCPPNYGSGAPSSMAGGGTTAQAAPPVSSSGQPLLQCTPRAQYGQAIELVTHKIQPSLTLSVGAGAGFSRTRENRGDPYKTSYYPAGDVSLAKNFGPRGIDTFTLSVSLTPLADVRTGEVSDHLQGLAALSDRVAARTTVVAGVGVADTVFGTDVSQATIVSGEVRAVFQLSPATELSVGDQLLYENQSGFGSFLQTFAYAAVTLRASPVKF